MNISQKFLLNNSLSEEKKNFYENLPNRYSKLFSDDKKKTSHEHNNFKKNVMTGLFYQNQETRMLLCSVENKKYTTTIYDAYSYLLRHGNDIKFRFSEEDNKEEEKFRIDPVTNDYNKYFGKGNYSNYTYHNNNLNKNPYTNMKEINTKDNEFLNYIFFYQS